MSGTSRRPPPDPLPEGLVAIGEVTRPHGLRGEVRVRPLTDVPERFSSTPEVRVVSPRGEVRVLGVEGARPHGGVFLVKLEGVDRPEAAEALRGHLLAVLESELVELEEGEYWHFQLEGLEVHDEEEGLLGRLERVLSRPGHDLYEIKGPRGEFLIPAVRAYVREVDLEAGRMVVRRPRGPEG